MSTSVTDVQVAIARANEAGAMTKPWTTFLGFLASELTPGATIGASDYETALVLLRGALDPHYSAGSPEYAATATGP